MCMCSDGFFFRNETYCRRIALVTCDQQPCFPGVECEEVSLPDPYDVDFFLSLDIIVLYQCGPCPPGYVGDGEMCEGGISEPFVYLTVLVLAAEPSDGDPILSSAFVRTFVSDPTSESGTREHRQARTADNGMVVLECPHNESIIVTANDADYFANSVTFRCNINQTNAVTLHLHKPYEDTIYVYHPESPREFGVGNETLNERYSIYFPQGKAIFAVGPHLQPDIFDVPASALKDAYNCASNDNGAEKYQPSKLILSSFKLLAWAPVHFDRHQFESGRADQKRKLKNSAVPTIFCHRSILKTRKSPKKRQTEVTNNLNKHTSHLKDHSYASNPSQRSSSEDSASTEDEETATPSTPKLQVQLQTQMKQIKKFRDALRKTRKRKDSTEKNGERILREVFDYMQLKVKEMKEEERLCCLTLDEMSLTLYEFDPSSGDILDSFNISDNQRVRLLFRSVNVSVTSELELAPEMIACIPNPTGTDVDIRAIETFGAVELTVIDLERRRAPPFKDDKEMVLTFPIQKLPADLSVGDKVPAWTFKFGSGCWEEDGKGELVIDEATGNLVWRYEANHFSWWAAGRVNPRTSCVTVRTCYDKDCSRPAPDTLIRIFGKDYGFETFRYTDTEGQMCVQFPYGRTVELSSPCTSGEIEVASTENPSSCDGGRFEIPKAPDHQMEETQDSCREAVLVIPEYEKSCPQPEKVHNNLALDKNMIRDAYPYTDVVHYSCSNPDYEITTHGYGNRVCTRCFSWTGILMCEPPEDEEFSY
ncbi:hypothetical protein HOLleu_04825 [Holothuria leucospilota]|uniref:Sushi domain-containing protein n=1 Tax=Holothuria leucospilota TaxID=206669 RepID=A0A9Q1HH03_HOLLE|nr:hypothetical protein HOLleu_04825 [Holothuria leucospilota]